jgi:hypothetical protein
MAGLVDGTAERACFTEGIGAHREQGDREDRKPSFRMVQKPVTPEGCLGWTLEGRRPQIRGLRAGGSLPVGRSTPATQRLSPAKVPNLYHA